LKEFPKKTIRSLLHLQGEGHASPQTFQFPGNNLRKSAFICGL